MSSEITNYTNTNIAEQTLCNQFSKISISSAIPLKVVTRSPLLELPSELLPIIFSFLSFKELTAMNYVCKATELATNNEGIWEKFCKQKNPSFCQTKLPEQLWKDFYKNEIDLTRYQTRNPSLRVWIRGEKWIHISVDMGKAKPLHLKKIIHQMDSSIPIESMEIFVSRKPMLDDDRPIASQIQANTSYILVLAKKK
jgi:hypothetical protein